MTKTELHKGRKSKLNIVMQRPKILILGYARHGKDTVAEILRDNHGYRFVSSSMFCAETVCRAYLAERGVTYTTAEECFDDRINHRAAWHDAIKLFNADDPTKLTKGIFEIADIYVGMRSQREYDVARHLYDLILWVDASGRGLPPEDISSMNIVYVPDQMIRIDNSGTLDDLNKAVAGLMSDMTWGVEMAKI